MSLNFRMQTFEPNDFKVQKPAETLQTLSSMTTY